MARKISANLSAAQVKALATDINDDDNGIERWFTNWVHVRADKLIDEIFQKEVSRLISEGKSISGSKDDIVLEAPVKSASERNQEGLQKIQQLQASEINQAL